MDSSMHFGDRQSLKPAVLRPVVSAMPREIEKPIELPRMKIKDAQKIKEPNKINRLSEKQELPHPRELGPEKVQKEVISIAPEIQVTLEKKIPTEPRMSPPKGARRKFQPLTRKAALEGTRLAITQATFAGQSDILNQVLHRGTTQNLGAMTGQKLANLRGLGRAIQKESHEKIMGRRPTKEFLDEDITGLN